MIHLPLQREEAGHYMHLLFCGGEGISERRQEKEGRNYNKENGNKIVNNTAEKMTNWSFQPNCALKRIGSMLPVVNNNHQHMLTRIILT